jgi:hypothetical protein
MEYIYDPGEARVASINSKRKSTTAAPIVGGGVALDTFYKKNSEMRKMLSNFTAIMDCIRPLNCSKPKKRQKKYRFVDLWWSSSTQDENQGTAYECVERYHEWLMGHLGEQK